MNGVQFFYAGRRTSLIVGGILLSGGYLGAYFALHAAMPSYTLMCFLFFLIGHGSITVEMVLLTVNSKNFPTRQRGTLVGCLTAATVRACVCFGLFVGQCLM